MSPQIGIFMLLHTEVASVNIVINCCHSSDSNTCSFGGIIQQFLVSCDTKMIPSHSMLDIQTLERLRLAIFWVEPSKSVSHSWEDSGSLYAAHHTHFWWLALNNERYSSKKWRFPVSAYCCHHTSSSQLVFGVLQTEASGLLLQHLNLYMWYTITAYTRLHSMLYNKVLLCAAIAVFGAYFFRWLQKKSVWKGAQAFLLHFLNFRYETVVVNTVDQ